MIFAKMFLVEYTRLPFTTYLGGDMNISHVYLGKRAVPGKDDHKD